MTHFLDSTGVCFTGKGNLDGKLVTRDVLDRLVRACGGIHYDTYSQQIDILVASRTDTTKAQKAMSHGKRVITYDEFWQMLGVTTHGELNALIEDDDWDAQRAARLRDQAAAEDRAADKRKQALEAQARADAVMDELAQIEGFNSF